MAEEASAALNRAERALTNFMLQ